MNGFFFEFIVDCRYRVEHRFQLNSEQIPPERAEIPPERAEMNWNHYFMVYGIGYFQLKWFIPVQKRDSVNYEGQVTRQ